MLELLTEKISGSLEKLKGAKKLNEKLVNDTLRDIRAALLEADVDYDVAKDFIKRLRERIFSEEIKTHLSPTDMIIMSVYDELVKTLGGNASPLEEGVVMFVGLQGTGKTTTIGKLANLMKKNGRSVMTVSTDVRRPAAMLQLKRVSELAGVEYLEFSPDKNPVDIAKEAFEAFKSKKYDYLFLDTAGRLHIDNELMEELRAIKEAVKPSEVIYVADSMQGQEALSVAKTFNEVVGLTGAILTKMDGDTRGGVALSIKDAIGIPIKYIGVGEKLEDIDQFYPDRIAQRILGLGDLQSLIEKAEQVISEDEAQAITYKMMRGEFDLNDLKKNISFMMNMGPLDKVLSMLPGVGSQLKNIKIDQKIFKRIIAMIDSMTPEERANPNIINLSRKQRIAKGSGTTVSDVNKLLKQYQDMKKMIRKLKNQKSPFGGLGLPF
ncbi:MAG: signal recognition particle protein [Hydrogenobaculum sp.]|jgi:signal recognition particle subunit FFH/SRP54 (srp54)|uniref:signal recognition particle protein n=1 Tax=unclassified Hydrogenobaculum TaxID=2622382 RepID=UPI0001C5254F|nr:MULTISPECIES: signal recognition particle protein [unclassified Hydrogenobaculum]AEF18700.1 signal recognition particle protein [Hydrogenobaculum sp. 3684]AEG45988.1 signal recognition particle protein [Hydrogenobaculum sp. SHO]AGG14631.1 signal recognition particle subunit FFH/SRP54 (srp54) [Hydrogenobaculum sp. HO]AGH92930.1 signal recognition particle subunit FFH/SRP54 (srp54) [Hydrogenobaculum sp. SN]